MVFSIEKNKKKNAEEILIQRSKNFSHDENNGTRKYGVRDSVQGNPRIKPLCRASSDFGCGSMKDLIQFLFEKNDVKSKNNIGINNCEHLAKRIFDRFAKRKYHEIGRGSATNAYDISMDMTNLVPGELNLVVSDKYIQYTSYSATHGGYLIFTELTLRLHHIAFVALLIAESQMVLGAAGQGCNTGLQQKRKEKYCLFSLSGMNTTTQTQSVKSKSNDFQSYT